LFFKFYFISVDLLTKAAEKLVLSGIRPSTRLVYDSVQKQYISFCSSHGLESIPATENTLLLYIAYLHIRRLKASSIRMYMSAIRSLHVEHGYGNPTEQALRVKLAIRAIEIDQPRPIQKLTITLLILQRIYPVISLDSYDEFMIWSAMCLDHFACLLTGEFTLKSFNDKQSPLLRTHVTFHHSQGDKLYMNVHLERSKTDYKNTGIDIVVGCTHCSMCPHCFMIQYCESRDRIHSNKGSLFLFHNSNTLTRELFIKFTRTCLARIGIDTSNFSGHSYRAGGATTAALSGLNDLQIRRLGRWKSNTYHRYIRPDQINLSCNITQIMVTRMHARGTLSQPYVKQNHTSWA
jgi:hypothetical protein